jgi:glutaredoxin
MAHKVEIFSADCPLCRETEKLIKGADCCKDSEIIVHKCSGDECCQPAKDYGITSVPSVVVDGQIKIVGKPTQDEIENILGPVCLN